jgi:hypothetical protein
MWESIPLYIRKHAQRSHLCAGWPPQRKCSMCPIPHPSDGGQLACGTDGPDAVSSRGRCDAGLRYGRRANAGCEEREKERGYASFAMPSTYRICPVIWEAASEAKNSTAAA